jgi:hypothetical protein
MLVDPEAMSLFAQLPQGISTQVTPEFVEPLHNIMILVSLNRGGVDEGLTRWSQSKRPPLSSTPRSLEGYDTSD